MGRELHTTLSTHKVKDGRIRQFAADIWVTECWYCPKQLSRRRYNTLAEASSWWRKEHMAPDSPHWGQRELGTMASRKARSQAEMSALLKKIGMTT